MQNIQACIGSNISYSSVTKWDKAAKAEFRSKLWGYHSVTEIASRKIFPCVPVKFASKKRGEGAIVFHGG